ncbi:hypothetical protein Tco_0440028 [Tanacetum coccineum]
MKHTSIHASNNRQLPLSQLLKLAKNEEEATTVATNPTVGSAEIKQEKEKAKDHMGSQLPELELTLTLTTRRELSQEINNNSVPILISQAPGPSRKRSRSPSTPSYPDATTFSDGKPASETPELNPEDVTARLEDMEVEIDTLHADAEDKELLISELQDSLATAENEISILQMRADDAENRRAEDHEQIQKILACLGL